MARVSFDGSGSYGDFSNNETQTPALSPEPTAAPKTGYTTSPYAGYRSNPDDVQATAQQVFGHDLSDPTPWVGQTDWFTNLANSPEAQAYAKSKAAAPPAAAAPGAASDPLARLKAARTSGDQAAAQAAFNEYFTSRGAKPEDWAYWGPRLMGPDGDYYLTNKLPYAEALGGGRDGAASKFGYDDPSSLTYLTSILDRINQLKQPQDTEILDLLKSLSLKRVDALGGAPYTAGDEAAMRAHYLDPLTQARDAALTRNKEAASAHGYLPSSGLVSHNNNAVEQGYEQAVAGAANDTALQAIDEKNRRANQQLDVLGNLLNTQNGQNDRYNTLQDEIVNLSGLFPAFDDKRLATLSGASKDDSSSLIQLLLSLSGQNTSRDAYAAGQAGDNAYAIAQMIYNAMKGAAK